MSGFKPRFVNGEIYGRPELSDYLGYIILASVVYVGMLGYGGVYDHRNLLKLRLVTARILKWSVAWVGVILLASFMVKFERRYHESTAYWLG